MVKRLFFGITCFEISGIGADIIQQMFASVAGNLKDVTTGFSCKSDVVSLCHCTFEDHSNLPVISEQLTQYLVSHSSDPSGIKIYFDLRTAHDCTAVLFAMSNIQETVAVAINFDNCGVRENQIIELISILAEGKLEIVHFKLRGSRLTISGLQACINRCSRW